MSHRAIETNRREVNSQDCEGRVFDSDVTYEEHRGLDRVLYDGRDPLDWARVPHVSPTLAYMGVANHWLGENPTRIPEPKVQVMDYLWDGDISTTIKQRFG